MKAWATLRGDSGCCSPAARTGRRSGTSPRSSPPTRISDQLKALSEPTRNLGLYRALRDNGQRCKRVDRGAYQQQYKTMAMWTAHCTDSGDWAVYIAPNGDVQVSPCARCRRSSACPNARPPTPDRRLSLKR